MARFSGIVLLLLAICAALGAGAALWWDYRQEAGEEDATRSQPARREEGGVPLIDPDHPCSAVCAALAAQWLQKPITLAEAGRAIPADSAGRASAASVVRGLQSLGFAAAAVRLPPEQVLELDLPLIVFTRGSHFAVVVPGRSGSVFLLDPPRGPARYSVNESTAQWAGEGILVAADEETLARTLRRLGISWPQ